MSTLAGDWIRIETEYLQACGLPLWLNALPHEQGILLLDSGTSQTPEASIRRALADAGHRIEDITLVVNSHAHPDHMGGNAALQAISAPVFAGPAAEAGWLEDNDLLVSQLWEPHPDAFRLTAVERADLLGLLDERVRVEHLLRDGDTLTVGDTSLDVVTTSGHSPGHIAVHDPDHRLLFTFDDVQGAGVPIAHSDVWLAPLYHDVDRYRAGLRRLLQLDFDTLVPAHGPPLNHEQGVARIHESLEFVDTAEVFVQDFLEAQNDIGLRDLAEALGTRLGPYGGATLQSVSVAKAHLDHEVRRGTATSRWRRTDGAS